MLRAIILVLVLFVAVGIIIPVATDYAEAGAKKTEWRKEKKKKRFKKYRKYITTRYVKGKKIKRKYRKPKKYKTTKQYRKTRSIKRYRKARTAKRYRSSKRYRTARKYRKARKTRRVRKYSKKWWSSYRAKTNRQKTIANRKRNLRLRQIRLEQQKALRKNSTLQVSSPGAMLPLIKNLAPNMPLIKSLTPGWMLEKSNNEQRPFAADDAPQQTNPDLTVVTNALSSESGRKNVAGVAISDLRKTVIDKMIQENGWVVNDLEKYVEGKKVYVVVAKSPDAGGAVKSRIFYFAESKGKIYNLETVAPDDSTTRIENQSEKLVKTLNSSGGTVQSAKKD